MIALAKQFAAELGWELTLSADAAEALLCWRWPFDVRELQSLIRTCFARGGGGQLGTERLDEAFPEIIRPLIERRTRSSGPPPQSSQRSAAKFGK